MNSLTIIGNVCNTPELRTTPAGKTVCNFNLAVNRRKANADGTREADFFRVSAWGELGDVCQKFITKGKKVCVVGSVGVHVYTNQKGEAQANLEVLAKEVEFLSPRAEQTEIDQQSGYQKVNTADLPY